MTGKPRPVYGIADEAGRYLRPGLELTTDPASALRFAGAADAESFLTRWACDRSLGVRSIAPAAHRQGACLLAAAARRLVGAAAAAVT